MLEIKKCMSKTALNCCYVTIDNYEEFMEIQYGAYWKHDLKKVEFKKDSIVFTWEQLEYSTSDIIHLNSWYVLKDNPYWCYYSDAEFEEHFIRT